MKYLLFIFLFSIFAHSQDLGTAQHCGFDFTSYLVINIHEEGAKNNIKNLKVSLVDLDGNELINTDNKYSWKFENKPMFFSFNYVVDDTTTTAEKKEKWFFPYAKDNYFLSVVNTFPADVVKVKIEDVDGQENGGQFETVWVDLGYFDLFVLCTNQAQQYVTQFGRKANKPLEVVLKKL